MPDRSTLTVPAEPVTAVAGAADIPPLKLLVHMVPYMLRALGAQAGAAILVMVITEDAVAVTPIFTPEIVSRSADRFQPMARMLW